MKNALESIGNIADYLEKKISELKYRNLEINQLDKERFFFCNKGSLQNYSTPTQEET